MKFVVWPNLEKQNAYATAVAVCLQLHTHEDAEICMESRYSEHFSELSYVRYQPQTELLCDADFAIAIGGDGTILRLASKLFAHPHAKLVGINTGRLGFLAAFERSELAMLEKLFTGDYIISEHTVLQTEMHGNTSFAVNDIYASRLGGRICDFLVYVDNSLIGTFRADGIIFSTPTGSTAYALSAGGPVMEPDLSLIEMNLICPHSLFSRPMLFAPQRKIRVEYSVSLGESDLLVHVDGSEQVRLGREESFTVTTAERRVPFVNVKGSAFYDALNGKLMRPLKDDTPPQLKGMV